MTDYCCPVDSGNRSTYLITDADRDGFLPFFNSLVVFVVRHGDRLLFAGLVSLVGRGRLVEYCGGHEAASFCYNFLVMLLVLRVTVSYFATSS